MSSFGWWSWNNKRIREIGNYTYAKFNRIATGDYVIFEDGSKFYDYDYKIKFEIPIVIKNPYYKSLDRKIKPFINKI